MLWFFFFSSRRRHTRSLCDWSSDVCSSDLPRGTAGGPAPPGTRDTRLERDAEPSRSLGRTRAWLGGLRPREASPARLRKGREAACRAGSRAGAGLCPCTAGLGEGAGRVRLGNLRSPPREVNAAPERDSRAPRLRGPPLRRPPRPLRAREHEG